MRDNIQERMKKNKEYVKDRRKEEKQSFSPFLYYCHQEQERNKDMDMEIIGNLLEIKTSPDFLENKKSFYLEIGMNEKEKKILQYISSFTNNFEEYIKFRKVIVESFLLRESKQLYDKEGFYFFQSIMKLYKDIHDFCHKIIYPYFLYVENYHEYHYRLLFTPIRLIVDDIFNTHINKMIKEEKYHMELKNVIVLLMKKKKRKLIFSTLSFLVKKIKKISNPLFIGFLEYIRNLLLKHIIYSPVGKKNLLDIQKKMSYMIQNTCILIEELGMTNENNENNVSKVYIFNKIEEWSYMFLFSSYFILELMYDEKKNILENHHDYLVFLYYFLKWNMFEFKQWLHNLFLLDNEKCNHHHSIAFLFSLFKIVSICKSIKNMYYYHWNYQECILSFTSFLYEKEFVLYFISQVFEDHEYFFQFKNYQIILETYLENITDINSFLHIYQCKIQDRLYAHENIYSDSLFQIHQIIYLYLKKKRFLSFSQVRVFEMFFHSLSFQQYLHPTDSVIVFHQSSSAMMDNDVNNDNMTSFSLEEENVCYFSSFFNKDDETKKDFFCYHSTYNSFFQQNIHIYPPSIQDHVSVIGSLYKIIYPEQSLHWDFIHSSLEIELFDDKNRVHSLHFYFPQFLLFSFMFENRHSHLSTILQHFSPYLSRHIILGLFNSIVQHCPSLFSLFFCEKNNNNDILQWFPPSFLPAHFRYPKVKFPSISNLFFLEKEETSFNNNNKKQKLPLLEKMHVHKAHIVHFLKKSKQLSLDSFYHTFSHIDNLTQILQMLEKDEYILIDHLKKLISYHP